MSYMESKMQEQIEGSIALQNAICDDACNIYKETGIMPMDMKAQRDDLLEALQKALDSNWSDSDWIAGAKAAVAKALGEKQ